MLANCFRVAEIFFHVAELIISVAKIYFGVAYKINSSVNDLSEVSAKIFEEAEI
jgi:hypothetical protein